MSGERLSTVPALRRQLTVFGGDASPRRLVVDALSARFNVAAFGTWAEARRAQSAQQAAAGVIFQDVPPSDFVDTLRCLKESGAGAVAIVGTADQEAVIRAMKAGASDCVPIDPLDPRRLLLAVEQAIENADLEQKLREVREELEDFVAVAAHDLKTPLATISGYLAAAVAAAGPPLSDDQQELINRSAEMATDLNQMLDRLVGFTRIGRDNTEFATVDLGAVTEAAVARIESAIADSRATIDIGSLPVVAGVASDMTQLMQNLLSNAVKFCQPDRPLRVVVEAKRDQETWVVSVIDNGIGVAKEHRESIFTRRRRLHDETHYPGWGLGLSVCRKIVRQHGGQIWVGAGHHGGAAFHFTLPLAANPTG